MDFSSGIDHEHLGLHIIYIEAYAFAGLSCRFCKLYFIELLAIMAGLVNLSRLFLNEHLSVYTIQIGGLGSSLLLFKGYCCGSYCKFWNSWWYLSIAHY